MAGQGLTLRSAAKAALVGALLIAAAFPSRAGAITLPPHPYFSLDPTSVSLAPQGPGDVFQSPKALSLGVGALGLPPGANVDAISPGGDSFDPTDPCPNLAATPPKQGFASNVYFWSVDRATVGRTGGGVINSVPAGCVSFGQPERIQAQSQDAAADVFIQLFTTSPKQRLNFVWWDEAPIGLLGSNQDEIDALEAIDTLTGLFVPDQNTYFSVDPPTAATLGVSGADVLYVPAGSTARTVLWPAAALGLQQDDDIDAMCVNTNFGTPPWLLISLGRGSPSLASGGYSPADVFEVRPGLQLFPGAGIQVPFLPARFLSLLQGDNVDALDCKILDPRSEPEIRTEELPPPIPLSSVGARCNPKLQVVPHGGTATFTVVNTGAVPILSTQYSQGAPAPFQFRQNGNAFAFATKADRPPRATLHTIRIRVTFGFAPNEVVANLQVKCYLRVDHAAAPPPTPPPGGSRFGVHVVEEGAGSGTVTSGPPGVMCPTRCDSFFDVFAPVDLTADEADGSVFGGWSGCDSASGKICRVRMLGGREVHARFEVERRPTETPPPPGPQPLPPPPHH